MISDAAGFVASGLVLLTFTMKDMRMLRIIAILSNLAFIAYGLLEWLPPVFTLHVVLLPLNAARLRQARINATERLPDKAEVLTSRSYPIRFAVALGR